MENSNNSPKTGTKQRPTVILCNPQMGENIGAAARAMLNFNLTDLRIVNPRDGWPSEQAQATAAGALDIMPPIKIYDTLGDAISDLNYVLATTARHRDMVKPVYFPDDAVHELHKQMEENKKKTGIVFGAERAGLTNDEISLCQGIMTFPTNATFASINLSQSVLLATYEWDKCTKSAERPTSLQENASPFAPLGDTLSFMDRLEKDLDARRFFRVPEMKPTMMVNIRNIFTRAEITTQELRTLHGILSALRGNKTQGNQE